MRMAIKGNGEEIMGLEGEADRQLFNKGCVVFVLYLQC